MNPCESLTYIIDEVADFLWVGRTRPVLRSGHKVWYHVVSEHLGAVVQTTVQNTQIIVLKKNTSANGINVFKA